MLKKKTIPKPTPIKAPYFIVRLLVFKRDSLYTSLSNCSPDKPFTVFICVKAYSASAPDLL